MSPVDAYLSPSDAAHSLGVSVKALRLYEERGLISPHRSEAGWRLYGPDQMARASDIVALRALGFSLAGIARLFKGDASRLDDALGAHQAVLERRLGRLAGSVATIGGMRAALARGETPSIAALTQLARRDEIGAPAASAAVFPAVSPAVSFELPWPWGGERFELREIAPITFIVGPLFSGKTRLCQRLAEEIPGAAFIPMERDGAEPSKLIEASLNWLAEDGATLSEALVGLILALEDGNASAHVVDLIEHGLDEPSQAALIAHLRRRAPTAPPLIATTRSSVILDLAALGPHERILLCPANHAPPSLVSPYPGAPGYEAVATCLAAPDVRARSEGVIAIRN